MDKLGTPKSNEWRIPMGAHLDLEDVAAGTPVAEKELWEKNKKLAERRRQVQALSIVNIALKDCMSEKEELISQLQNALHVRDTQIATMKLRIRDLEMLLGRHGDVKQSTEF